LVHGGILGVIVNDDKEVVSSEVGDHPEESVEGSVLGQVAIAGGVGAMVRPADWGGEGGEAWRD